MPQDIDAAARLIFDGALTVRTVETVLATLREAIEPVPEGPLIIDCSAAPEIDLTFVQMLIATRISARQLGFAVSLAACPEGALLDTLTRGGFQVARDGDEIPGFWFEGSHA